MELIGRGEHQRLLFWEAAEGGVGVWERLTEEAGAFARLTAEALRICHFDPTSGDEEAGWAGRCGAACYDCRLSYANQPEHRHLDRQLVREFLLDLARSEAHPARVGRSYDEQYRWLCERVDPASSLEREFLAYLYGAKLRLPDCAQYCPTPEVAAQADFYYERPGLPGVCVFIDGRSHEQPDQAERDRLVRAALEDRGHRVVALAGKTELAEQIRAHPDVFRPVVGEGAV